MTGVLAAGLCTVDLVQRVDVLPVAGEKVQSGSVELAAGGPAANAAVAVASLGGRVRLVTVLGEHSLAGLARQDLAACGVEVVDVRPRRGEPPSLSAVVVRESDGERTVVSHNAAGVRLPSDVAAEVDIGDWGDWGAVLLDGHHPELAVGLARAARERGIPTVLDAGSWKTVLPELLPMVDVCACSSSFRMPDLADEADTDRALHSLGVPVVIRTHGPDPVTWSTVPHRPEGHAASGREPVRRVTARDTSGAGDVWHGALALGIAGLGRVPDATELPTLINAANEAAAVRVRHEGARSWVEPMRTSAR